MNISHLSGGFACAIQFIVALYALQLNRRYGTSAVGWSLFGAFALLAILQFVQSLPLARAALGAGLKINAIYTLISFLLLTGMAHLGTVLKERNRVAQLEKQFRADLESEVKLKTAHLNRAIEELVMEMEKTRAMSASIEFVDAAVFWQSIAQTPPLTSQLQSPAQSLGTVEENSLSWEASAPMPSESLRDPRQLALFNGLSMEGRAA